MRSHTGEKPYQCCLCDEVFLNKGVLDQHMITHTGEKPYQCSQCDKSFIENSNLDQHVMIHTGEKPYECTHCEKALSNKKDLDCHMSTHSGDKPYQCCFVVFPMLHVWVYMLWYKKISGASRIGGGLGERGKNVGGVVAMVAVWEAVVGVVSAVASRER